MPTDTKTVVLRTEGDTLWVAYGDNAVPLDIENGVELRLVMREARRLRERAEREERRASRPGGALFGEGYTGGRELLYVFDNLQAVHEYYAANDWNEDWCPVLVRSTDGVEMSVDDDGVWFEI